MNKGYEQLFGNNRKERKQHVEYKSGNSKLTAVQKKFRKSHPNYIVKRGDAFPVWY